MAAKKYSFETVIFDLDGVVTKTALVHAKAWKASFDEYLRLREKRDGEPFKEFTHENDYLPYVDGKPRYEGVRSFLESRGINIPYGEPSDAPDRETICGIGNRKNSMFREVLKKEGAEIYTSTVQFIKKLKKAGVRVGVASSSKNCKYILQSAKMEGLFETRVDGEVSVELDLKGKPEGDIFATAALNLGGTPPRSVVVEDATSGVQAGRNGGFGLVLGIARENNETELAENGADIIVRDMAEIDMEDVEDWFKRRPRPIFESWDSSCPPGPAGKRYTVNACYGRSAREALFGKERLIFFLDYDGTLTPIVERPDLAVLSQGMRDVVTKLSKRHTVAIVSGRMREDVENLVRIEGLFYAGSHGFDIKGPGFSMVQPKAKEVIPVVSEVIAGLKEKIGGIPGALIEEKRFSVAAHYRLAKKKDLPRIKAAVNDAVGAHSEALRLMSGKMVYEILPNIEWDKGKAIRWMMEVFEIAWSDAAAIYIGDDVTDEFAFRALRTRGTSILVAKEARESPADFMLSSTEEVKGLFEKVIAST